MTMIFGFKFVDKDDRKILATPGVRLVFEWQGDRWTHALEVADEAKLTKAERERRYLDFWAEPEREASSVSWLRVADSIEDTGRDPRRVVSPVYQQFHWQEDAGGRAFLLGQSGPHHFSAVFSSASTAHYRIDADIADRCREPIEALASTYQITPLAGELVEAETNQAEWSHPDRGRLALATFFHGGIAVAPGPGGAVQHAQVYATLKPGEPTQRLYHAWMWST